jgi:hypothetical protein
MSPFTVMKTARSTALRAACFFALIAFGRPAHGASATALLDFRETLEKSVCRQLDLLFDEGCRVVEFKGKDAESPTAMAFWLLSQRTNRARYLAAALTLTDRIVTAMRATPFGVLYIKEKEKGEEMFSGGGPPPFGWYTANAAAILAGKGGREKDLLYVAGALDAYPWNPGGWWAADIDIKTGEPKVDLSKPSPINKNAAVAQSAAILSRLLPPSASVLADRLAAKAVRCLSSNILPAQEADGFWHYGLTGRDPKNKDVIGYFMLASGALAQWRLFAPTLAPPGLEAAMARAGAFAVSNIYPMTEPNRGPKCPVYAGAETPARYTIEDDLKRGYQLALLLFATGHDDEGLRIMEAWLPRFPYGDRGMDGTKALHASALILEIFRRRGDR